MATFIRSPLQVLEDAMAKKRVFDGIALLEAEYGSDWADKIDLDTLQLCSPTRCVLGQLYSDVELETLTPAQQARIDAWGEEQFAYGGGVGAMDREDILHLMTSRYSGYDVGRRLLDGPLDEYGGPAKYGFDLGEDIWLSDLVNADEGKLAEFGCTREQVVAAADYAESMCINYAALDVAWKDVIASRRARS